MGEAVLAATALVPLLTFGLDTAGGMRAALEMRLVVVPFSIEIMVFAQSFFFKLTGGGTCVKMRFGERGRQRKLRAGGQEGVTYLQSPTPSPVLRPAVSAQYYHLPRRPPPSRFLPQAPFPSLPGAIR